MEGKKIRVAWICSFSNPHVREKLHLKPSRIMMAIGKIMGKPLGIAMDTAIWNTNAIEEMEKRDDVELHVICPVRGLSKKEVCYEENGIHYYFFRDQNSNVVRFIFHQLFTRYTSKYKINRRQIRKFIGQIQPEIVHVIGAENPFYSLALLDIPERIPTIIQLQTLLDRIAGVTREKKEIPEFRQKGLIERELFRKATYIGTRLKEFREYIRENIKPDAKFLDTGLAMGNKINLEPRETTYDFVYFSADICKAGEDAIEVFALAHKEIPTITLDIVGGYDTTFKDMLDKKIRDYQITSAVTFEGRLPTHDDVIRQIRKARFGLLPLKMDFVPNTLKELMANGIPTVTTITEGTPDLNKERQSVLLSSQGDYHTMANNIIHLINDTKLQEMLKTNAAVTVRERSNNAAVVDVYCQSYKQCLKEWNDKK